MKDVRQEVIKALKDVAARLGHPSVEFDVWWVKEKPSDKKPT